MSDEGVISSEMLQLAAANVFKIILFQEWHDEVIQTSQISEPPPPQTPLLPVLLLLLSLLR